MWYSVGLSTEQAYSKKRLLTASLFLLPSGPNESSSGFISKKGGKSSEDRAWECNRLHLLLFFFLVKKAKCLRKTSEP